MLFPSLYDFKEAFRTVTISRNGEILGKVRVLWEKEKFAFSFPPDTAIPPQIGDIITVRNKSYMISDIEEEEGFDDDLYAFVAIYENPQNSYEHASYPQQVFNIKEVNNSILGSQQNATITIHEGFSDVNQKIESVTDNIDREELRNLLSQIKNILESEQSVKKGHFSKIFEKTETTLKKYPNILSALMKLFFTWLTQMQ